MLPALRGGGTRHLLPIPCLLVSVTAFFAPKFLLAQAPTESPHAEHHPVTGTDLDGVPHRIGGTPGCRGTALVFLLTDCPISNGSVPALNKLAKRFENHSIEFYGVVSDDATTRDDAVRHARAFELSFPVLFDASGILRKHFQPTHAPEVFVLDAKNSVTYRGRVDDQYAELGRKAPQVRRQYLKDALTSLVRGREPKIARTEPVGCLLEDPPEKTSPGSVTYARDIAPIMQAHCVVCHRSGEVAPFPLETYEDVRRRRRQIVLVTERKLMPPWKAEPGPVPYRNERRLSQAEMQLLQQWVDDGAPLGDRDDLPQPRDFGEGWQLGEPDAVFKMPEPFEIPAGGRDILQHFVLAKNLSADRMISAIEVRPGNPRVVHHAVIFFDTSHRARQLERLRPGPGYRSFGGPGFQASGGARGWVPGMTVQPLPDDMGRFIRKGSDLVLQIHYHPTGKRETDQTEVGVYFAPSDARRPVTELIVSNMNLRIPAGEKRHHHHASYTLPVDLLFLDAWPHMHYLGSEIKATAHPPEGEPFELIHIKKWDFNWQNQFVYSKPIKLRKGTRIDVECYYDNTAENPLNPNSPPKEVLWGEQSTDEMGICHFHVTPVRLNDVAEFNTHYFNYMKKTVTNSTMERPRSLRRRPRRRSSFPAP